MALSEYKFGDRTYLFDDDHVPEGAELVKSDIAAEQVVVFPDQKVEDEKSKAKPKPTNKAAPTPQSKE